MSDFIIDMSTPQDASIVGGKAAVLMALAAQGFNVPPFFVITPEAFDKNGLKPTVKVKIDAALKPLKGHKFAVRSSGREEDGASHSHADARALLSPLTPYQAAKTALLFQPSKASRIVL